jgi:hypothetical protein
MFKYIFTLCAGLAAGYTYGFKDAKEHRDTVVTRTIERIGGSSRDKYRTDVDATMDRLEKR